MGTHDAMAVVVQEPSRDVSGDVSKRLAMVKPDVLQNVCKPEHHAHFCKMGLYPFFCEVDWTKNDPCCNNSMVAEFISNYRRTGNNWEAGGTTSFDSRPIEVTLPLLGQAFHLQEGVGNPCQGKDAPPIKTLVKTFPHVGKNGGYTWGQYTDPVVKERLEMQCWLVEMRSTAAISKKIVLDVENSANKSWYSLFAIQLLKELDKLSEQLRQPEAKPGPILVAAHVRAIILAIIKARPIAASISARAGPMGSSIAAAAASDPTVASAPTAAAGVDIVNAAERGGVEFGHRVALDDAELADAAILRSQELVYGEGGARHTMLTGESNRMFTGTDVARDTLPTSQAGEEEELDEVAMLRLQELAYGEGGAGHTMPTGDSNSVFTGTDVARDTLPISQAIEEEDELYEEAFYGLLAKVDEYVRKESGNTSDCRESDGIKVASARVKVRQRNRLVIVSDCSGGRAQASGRANEAIDKFCHHICLHF
jgi:hypothetical protein